MSTRAQIAFMDGNDVVALVYQHSDGYPTGAGGVVGKLIEICVPLIKQRGLFDPAYLAAQTLHRLIQNCDYGQSGLGFGIDNVLHGDTRFLYTVNSEGVTVYDARILDADSLDNLAEHTPMFFTAWVDDEKRRKVEAEIRDTEARLNKLHLERASLARRKP
jgi:hypothetical protein